MDGIVLDRTAPADSPAPAPQGRASSPTANRSKASGESKGSEDHTATEHRTRETNSQLTTPLISAARISFDYLQHGSSTSDPPDRDQCLNTAKKLGNLEHCTNRPETQTTICLATTNKLQDARNIPRMTPNAHLLCAHPPAYVAELPIPRVQLRAQVRRKRAVVRLRQLDGPEAGRGAVGEVRPKPINLEKHGERVRSRKLLLYLS